MVQGWRETSKLLGIVSGLLRLHIGPPAVNRNDDRAFSKDRHRVPHRGVGNPVLVSKAPFAGELRRDLALGDPSLYVVRHLDIGIFRTKRINRTSSHRVTIECSLSCANVD
jgi:hypothetical protein